MCTLYSVIHASYFSYQEYISDKNHVHMNSTCWSTLNGFIDSLAQSGIVEAEMTERVVFVLKDIAHF